MSLRSGTGLAVGSWLPVAFLALALAARCTLHAAARCLWPWMPVTPRATPASPSTVYLFHAALPHSLSACPPPSFLPSLLYTAARVLAFTLSPLTPYTPFHGKIISSRCFCCQPILPPRRKRRQSLQFAPPEPLPETPYIRLPSVYSSAALWTFLPADFTATRSL